MAEINPTGVRSEGISPSEARKAFSFIILLLIVCFIIVHLIAPEIFLRVNLLFIAYAYAVYFAIMLLFGLRWKINTAAIQRHVSIKQLINMEFMSTFAKFLSPFQLNIPFRSFFLKDYGVAISDSISLSLFELFIEIVVACAGGALLGFCYGYNYFFILIVPLVLIAAYLLVTNPMLVLLSRIQGKVKVAWLRKVLDMLINLPRAIEKCSSRFMNVVSLFFLTILIYLLRSLKLWVVIMAFDLSVPFGFVFFTVCIANILSTLSRIPMGMGIREATGILLFSPFMEASYACSVLLVLRIIGTSVILFFGGGLFIAKYHGRIRKLFSERGG